MTKLENCIRILKSEIQKANGAGFIRPLATPTANEILRQLEELREENKTLRAECNECIDAWAGEQVSA